jgi:hypothetical protein
MDKHSSLLQTFVSYSCKRFYSYGPWCEKKSEHLAKMIKTIVETQFTFGCDKLARFTLANISVLVYYLRLSQMCIGRIHSTSFSL